MLNKFEVQEHVSHFEAIFWTLFTLDSIPQGYYLQQSIYSKVTQLYFFSISPFYSSFRMSALGSVADVPIVRGTKSASLSLPLFLKIKCDRHSKEGR